MKGGLAYLGSDGEVGFCEEEFLVWAKEDAFLSFLPSLNDRFEYDLVMLAFLVALCFEKLSLW